MDFTQRMFDLLKAQNKTKAGLAKFLGIRANTVTEWDTKGKKPSAEYISRISEYLNVSCDYLLTGKNDIKKKNMLTENEEEILKLLNQLSERNQIKLIGKVEEIVKNMSKTNGEDNICKENVG